MELHRAAAPFREARSRKCRLLKAPNLLTLGGLPANRHNES